MLKVEITDKHVSLEGDNAELLMGIIIYLEALRKNGISDSKIKRIIENYFYKRKTEGLIKDVVETIIDNNDIKIQKINLNGLTEEDARKIFEKEIFNKLF